MFDSNHLWKNEVSIHKIKYSVSAILCMPPTHVYKWTKKYVLLTRAKPLKKNPNENSPNLLKMVALCVLS